MIHDEREPSAGRVDRRPGRRLLCVFAHPDDESYGPGGTIARCALEGVDVRLLMFTCGEAGSIGVSKHLPCDELCRRRTTELAAACDALGVGRHRVVGVPDGAVSQLDADRGRREILAEIDAFQPQVLVTFHHEGVSGHPDHVAVARFLDDAFDASAGVIRGSGGKVPPARLFQWGIPREKSRLYQRDNLVPMSTDEIDAVVEIPDAAMDRKVEAIVRHATQIAFFETLRAKFDYREVSRPEYFHLRRRRDDVGAAGWPGFSDLFEGIEL